jgi:uncharacterized protein (DUF1684 family)
LFVEPGKLNLERSFQPMRGNRKIIFAFLLLAHGAHGFSADTDRLWSDQLQQWRQKHAASLSAPDGWLSVVALDWLKTGSNTFGSASNDSIRLAPAGNIHYGIIDVQTNMVRLKAPAQGFPAELRVDGHAAAEQTIVIDGPHPTLFTAGTLTFFIIRRGEQLALRVKDSQAPSRLSFRGLHWYPVDPRYRVEAQWIPLSEPKQVNVQTAVGIVVRGLVPGIAKFTIQGHEIALEPVVESLDDKGLMFVLRDATSGRTTYPASRFLHTSLPDRGLSHPGRIVLDFNRLENPPCAFTPFATCPLPLDGNRLRVALPVGELNYGH